MKHIWVVFKLPRYANLFLAEVAFKTKAEAQRWCRDKGAKGSDDFFEKEDYIYKIDKVGWGISLWDI